MIACVFHEGASAPQWGPCVTPLHEYIIYQVSHAADT